MKFRSTRGSYRQSMETTREVNSLQELATILETTPDNIRITPYTKDYRNGWDTHTVEVLSKHEPGKWSTEGLSDGVFEVSSQ